MRLKSNTAIKFFLILMLGRAISYGQTNDQTQNYNSSVQSNGNYPLGQLIPVNQINLQKGVHLFDIEIGGKQWSGVTNPFDSMTFESLDTTNNEGLLKFRYALPLGRYTYIGASLGLANRWESDLYDESGMTDPEFFIGHHLPWKNGNVRLGLSVSPSLGNSVLNRDINLTGETAKGNFYRGGWSARPEAAVTLRTGKVLVGAEFSYLYFGERTQEERVNVAPEALGDSVILNGLSRHYLGSPSGLNQNLNYFANDPSVIAGLENVENKITGGSVWAIKGLIEVPDWQRAGVEFVYGQVENSMRENNFGQQLQTEGGDFQEVRLYGRYKVDDQMSVTPVISWMPSMPVFNGQGRMDSTTNVWGAQITIRTKFHL